MTCFVVVWTTWAYDDKCSILFFFVPSAGSNSIPGVLEHIFQARWLNNCKMIAETRSHIFRWRSRFRRLRVCLSSLMTKNDNKYTIAMMKTLQTSLVDTCCPSTVQVCVFPLGFISVNRWSSLPRRRMMFWNLAKRHDQEKIRHNFMFKALHFLSPFHLFPKSSDSAFNVTASNPIRAPVLDLGWSSRWLLVLFTNRKKKQIY